MIAIDAKLVKVALGIILNSSGEVLVVKRVEKEEGEDGSKLVWAFPGGKPEEGEDLKRAAVREVLQETGFLVSLDKEIHFRVHPQFPVELHYFSGKVISKKPLREIEDTHEIANYRWVKPEEIRGLFTTDLDSKVAELLGI